MNYSPIDDFPLTQEDGKGIFDMRKRGPESRPKMIIMNIVLPFLRGHVPLRPRDGFLAEIFFDPEIM